MQTKRPLGFLSRTAADIMVRDVVALAPDTSLAAAVSKLLLRGFSGAPVVDADRHLVGMLSERDCLQFMASAVFHDAPPGTVGESMSRDVESVPPDTDIFRLSYLFHEHPFRRLPVVDEEGQLVGLITRRDLVRAFEDLLEERARTEHKSTYDLLRERRGD